MLFFLTFIILLFQRLKEKSITGFKKIIKQHNSYIN